MILFDVGASDLMRDVYFRRDFLELHAAPDPVVLVESPTLRYGAAIRLAPGAGFTDLETPHGYGGPVASDEAALDNGMMVWRRQHRDAGRRAEFIRLHPFINAKSISPHVDFLTTDRETVVVDLTRPHNDRIKAFSKGTRHALKSAGLALRVRLLDPTEWWVMRDLHKAVYERHGVSATMRFSDDYYRQLLSMPWAQTWCAEADGVPVAASCFLCANGTLAHYHISGGGDDARRTNAHYLLLNNAITTFAEMNVRWLHLGGGATNMPDDPLFRFKTRFSDIRAKFYIAGLIFDHERYRATEGGKKGRFLNIAENGKQVH